MTRRLVKFILLAVWGLLLAGGLAAYFTVRAILIEELDASLVTRAMSLPSLADAGVRPQARPDDRWRIQDDLGRTIARPTTAPRGRASTPTLVTAVFSRLGDRTRVRTLTLRVNIAGQTAAEPGQTLTVVYSGSAEQLDRLLNRLAVGLIATGAACGLLAALVVVRISRSALRPLHATAEAIGTIDEHNLSRRIDASQLPEELAAVGHRLNEMLQRLDQSFTARREFLASAAHELRTPVAALVTTLEVALRQPREADAYRRTARSCLNDAQAMRRLVERLMEQARSEAGALDEPDAPVNVSAILNECADIADALGRQRNIAVSRCFDADLAFITQPARLRSIVMNLLTNAIEYNRPDGQVELSCAVNGDGLELRVRDTGLGIAPEDLGRVFEPFFRANPRRNEVEHLGLGLALVRSHAKALGGDCRVESEPGRGSLFTIRLPARKAGKVTPA